MRAVQFLLRATIVAAAAWIGADLLVDANEYGAPDFGRTANMDKWANPWPMLMLVGAAAGLLAPRRRARGTNRAT
ncbi:hypothetical protein LK533_03260 [Sphingomonas sp. PL-96]|uniref:hypothetical protein n=1 Tax=Sphingomonas sp. PL-96 TaxID=2887201 RepID=UPI001E4A0929|nr:hypothetical protein [Sphingomonas sp. PL-96]MCC2975693.1 hypothetical protein [Sphingomonas sp. PL-96]